MKFKHFIPIISILFTLSLNAQQANTNIFHYEINLENHEDDIFHVSCITPALTPADSIYNFVAFAPGVHQVLDFGRFVESFHAYDKNNNEIKVENISTNEWRISEPEKVHKIVYDIEDSYDAEVEDHYIYPMSGTGIQDSCIVLNPQGVIGYLNDRKSDPVTLEIKCNPEWMIGTALNKNSEGIYEAESYYRLADSPLLLGYLSAASTMIGDIDVGVYVYSSLKDITSDKILELAEDVLNTAYDFTTFAPVDRYTFLMYLFDRNLMSTNPVFYGAGALEHSYSSTYTFPAVPQILPYLTNGIAHEFMHILTPLNLRSEIIAYFDYSKPTAEDQHLWLYEGVTEWVSQIMQLRGGLIDLDEYMQDVSQKINRSKEFDTTYSLARLSSEWFTEEGNKNYGNIYQLGALTAGALDINILELSNGKRGLRELYLELINKYGKNKPFNNATFFDEVVDMTYPEIRDFIDDYIKGNRPLDYAEIYGKLGLNYIESRPSENKTPIFGLQFRLADEGRLLIAGFSREYKNFGLKEGDVILEVFNREATMANSDSLLAIKNEMKAGDNYTVKVKRGDEELEFTGELFERMEYHVFEIDENANDEQVKLRELWSKNLALK